MADAHACKWTFQNPLQAIESTEKVWARVSKENHSQRLQTVFSDMKFQFFVEFISFIGSFISNISKRFKNPKK